MFLALWEFEVKPGCEKRFESVYGPGGDWARLFRTDAAYQGTRLFRDTTNQNLYLTIDSWVSRVAYENFLQSHASEYQSLDTVCEGLNLSEHRIGAFEEIIP